MVDPRTPDRKVTQDDVARHAGVTRSLVSYVLNGTNRTVATETRERILRAIDELGYRPNKFAQSLGAGRDNPLASRQIGIILNSAEVFLRPYYAEILAGIHAKAHEENYHVRFIRFFGDLYDPVLFNALIHHEEICGLILIALDQSVHTPEDTARIAQIRERIDNLVCVEWNYPGLSSVTFDRRGAARTATAHLLSLGHRHIAYIGQSDERISGFRQALREGGLAQGEDLVLEFAADMRGGHEAAPAVLGRAPHVTALLAGSDEVAIGILRYLAEQGLDVPGQISVVSIDNIEMSEFTAPPLTTIHVPKGHMGRQAVSRLIAFQDDRDEGPVMTVLPCHLVVRQSCAPPFGST